MCLNHQRETHLSYKQHCRVCEFPVNHEAAQLYQHNNTLHMNGSRPLCPWVAFCVKSPSSNWRANQLFADLPRVVLKSLPSIDSKQSRNKPQQQRNSNPTRSIDPQPLIAWQFELVEWNQRIRIWRVWMPLVASQLPRMRTMGYQTWKIPPNQKLPAGPKTVLVKPHVFIKMSMALWRNDDFCIIKNPNFGSVFWTFSRFTTVPAHFHRLN